MPSQLRQSLLISALIALCLTGLFDKLYHLTPLPAFEQEASDYLADIRERAAYSYAAARTLNATISLLESVDAGVGVVSIQPGQILEPINDMIEQFSDLMLIALASVGVQEILIAVLGDISWTYLLPLALLPLLIAPFTKSYQARLNRLGTVLIVSVIATRLLIPTIALGGQVISNTYLKPDYDQAIHHVETVREKTNEAVGVKPKNTQPLPSLTTGSKDTSVFSPTPQDTHDTLLLPDWETVKGLANSDKLVGMLNNVPDRVITLITIFTFETIAWPILMALLFLWIARLVLPPRD
ncbi:hypothetical protein RYZ26_14320 [Terasakiella sp. A23]|uniref:hypothetical protein n=1 Tax=Terasakiella sp. FCG-A23 TaxID=3080561 RepID=UPI0029558635|nr:hypothetical protein [Terasakiella sp. A23]MDV7340777.1 hypothetical protein [Terasakiella sp. A23]